MVWYLFESNHCGIETLLENELCVSIRIWIEPLWDWNINELTANIFILPIWIEPLWDWN